MATKKTKKSTVKKGAIIAATVAAVACAETPQPSEQTIILAIGGVQSGQITKGATDILSATAPSSTPTLTLVSEDGEHTYTATPGVPLSVRLGRYTITGNYIPETLKSIPPFGFAYAEPRYKVASTIEVVEGQEGYEVSGEYDCFALLIDYATTEKYRATNASGNWEDVGCLTRIGEHGVAYIWTPGASAKGACKISAVPTDTETYEETAFDVAWKKGAEGLQLENGKWYLFSAGAAPRESGNIGIDLPGWEAGN